MSSFTSIDSDGNAIPAQLTKGYIHCKKFLKSVTYAITKYNQELISEAKKKVQTVSDDVDAAPTSTARPSPTPASELNKLKDVLGTGDGGKAAEEQKVMLLSRFKIRFFVLSALSLTFPFHPR